MTKDLKRQHQWGKISLRVQRALAAAAEYKHHSGGEADEARP